MSIAMLSAISLICADVALPPLTTASTAPFQAVAAASVQSAPLTEPPAAAAEDEPVAPSADDAPTAADASVSEEEVNSVPLVFEGESDEQAVARLEAYLESVDTLNGEFTQVSPSGAISTGRFYIRRPGLLRFEYDPPTPLLIVANGGMVYVRDEALETTDSYPLGRTPLKFLLRKKVDLEDATVVGVDRGVDSLAVTFASDEDETEGELTVIVAAPEMRLVRWIVRDIQNGITVVTLDNVKSGERLANRLFRTPDAGGAFLKN